MSHNANGPVLVQNPSNGRHVNVTPLLELAHELGGFHKISEQINEAIRFIVENLAEETQASAVRAVCSNLYCIADSFTEVEEFGKSFKAQE